MSKDDTRKVWKLIEEDSQDAAMSPREMKRKFITDNAEFMLDEFKEVLQGNQETFRSESTYAIKTAYPYLFEIIANTSDIDASLAKTSTGIISMLAEGRINAQEAIQLLNVVDKINSVNEKEMISELKKEMINNFKDKELNEDDQCKD